MSLTGMSLFQDMILQYTDVRRAVQCALWGYPTEGAYHRDASSTDSLLAIRIPFLAINAEDDPVSTLHSICTYFMTDN